MPVSVVFGDTAPAMLSDNLAAEPLIPNTDHPCSTLFAPAPGSRSKIQSKDGDSLYSDWEKAAAVEAQLAHDLATRWPNSPAAQVRLAHALLLAGQPHDAIQPAKAALKIIKKHVNRFGPESFDFTSAVAAGRMLFRMSEGRIAEELVRELPQIAIVQRLRAEIAVNGDSLEQALELLEGDRSPSACSLRGYIYLRTSRNQEALSELKVSWNSKRRDPDDALNMALAFWRLGSTGKAIRYARQASHIAPGRKDISFTLLEYLLRSGDPAGADMEVRQIKSRGYEEPVEFLLLQARVALDVGKVDRSRALMRQARDRARLQGLEPLASEVEGNLIYSKFAAGELDATTAQDMLRSLMIRVPTSLVLLEMFTLTLDKVGDVAEVERRLVNFRITESYQRLDEIETQVAFISCQFERARDRACEWLASDPTDNRGLTFLLMLDGIVSGDWQHAADIAQDHLERPSNVPLFWNNAAYALALAGRGRLAAQVLKRCPLDDCYVRATAGLIELAQGKIRDGLRLYREAAELADIADSGQALRSLMTQYQGMALRHFNLLGDPELMKSISAGALPDVALPENWEDMPGFRLMQYMSIRRGWSWPMGVN